PRGQQRDGVRPAPLTPTVYIVDDDTEMRETLRSLVSSVNLPVETYASRQESLETQNGSRAGCLVVDLRMPGLSGIDLQDELVARNAKLPVIMISGYGDVPTAARAMRAGAIDFLEKPISRQLLLDRVREGLDVDRQRRRAEAEKAEITGRVARLTPRERQVMEMVVGGNPRPTCKAPAQPTVSFANNVQPIFTRSCALAGCHVGPVPTGPVDLSLGQTYAQTVNVKSAQQPNLKRFLPGKPDQSYIIHKIEGGPNIAGVLMPQGCPGAP